MICHVPGGKTTRMHIIFPLPFLIIGMVYWWSCEEYTLDVVGINFIKEFDFTLVRPYFPTGMKKTDGKMAVC